ncbi:hypothetical protein JFL47_14210 [Haemophilus haemoglobinophilus]|nr:hypothetical protein [Canicola haemoglobinophilus]MBN6712342.1 hypothetical protein [Canicola haemoglobinophilus]
MNFETPLGDKGIAQSNKQAVNDKGEKLYTNSQGEQTTQAKGQDGKANKPILETGLDSLTGSVSAGFGSDKESQHSQTQSGIGTANIHIRDEKAQFEKTGKTVEQTLSEIKTDTTTETAESRSGKLENTFDKEKVLKELNIQVKATQDFRKNAFSTIDAYVLPKQAKLREQIKQAKTEEEKTALYNEIYKLQYQKRLLETVVGIVAGSPEVAITQGTLQLAATKIREETLANSRKFPGIKDAKTGKVYRNDSYDSGYFDGAKLGGVRIDRDKICSLGKCVKGDDNIETFYGNANYPSLDKVLDPNNPLTSKFYGLTGGHQPEQGGWYTPFGIFRYDKGDLSDFIIESWAGSHDLQGGQIWGWYDKDGNTAQKSPIEEKLSDVTTGVAIFTAAPFAVSDLLSSDMVEILMKIGGN